MRRAVLEFWKRRGLFGRVNNTQHNENGSAGPHPTPGAPHLPKRRLLLERLEERLLFDAGPQAPSDIDMEMANEQTMQSSTIADMLDARLIEPAETRPAMTSTDAAASRINDQSQTPSPDQDAVPVLDPNVDTEPIVGSPLNADVVAAELLTTADEQRTELRAATVDLRRELAFVDTSVADYQTLVDGIREHGDEFRQIEIVLIDAGEDGLAKISEVLRAAGDIDAIHIVSHGSETGFGLGGVWVTSESFGVQAGEFAAWGRALSEQADLLIYGCNLAATESGRELMQSISMLTGADVAASDDRTGHVLRNADWDLEVETGLIESAGAVSSAAQAEWNNVLAASMVVDPDPVTWHLVGLDSNNVNAGPDRFPIGARVTNNGTVALTNVTASFVWDSANANINVSGVSTVTIDSLAVGASADVYFNVVLTRTTAVYNTSRDYHINFTSDQGATTSGPNREVYAEKLVSQNRNSVASVAELSSGLTTLQLGNTYTIRMIGSTATNGYEQLEHFIDLPTDKLKLLNVSATYTAPAGATNDSVYADAAGWDDDPASPTYRTVIGPANYPGGKAGGNMVIDYVVKVIGVGTVPVTSTIHDFSGSSYHYNSDYRTEVTFALVSAPTTANNTVTTSEETSRTFVAGDFPFSDTDGGTLQSVKIVSLPADGLIKLNGVNVTAGQVITIANINAGLLTFMPDANENGSPYTTFNFSVSDGTLSSGTATMTVNVTPVNDPPAASGTIPNQTHTDSQTIAALNVSGFFSDIDAGDTLTFSATSLPSGLSIHATTGIISGTIDRSASLISPYSVTITATDSGSATATRSFSWTVTNPAPTATDNAAAVTEDGPTSDTGNVLTDNDGSGVDSDSDGDPLSVSEVNGDAASVGVPVSGGYGSLTVNSNGSYSYSLDNSLPAVQALNNGQTVTDSFTYTITDSEGGTSTATLTVTISGVTDPSVSGPSVFISKGTVTSDNGGATFSTAVGPASATFQAPGSAISFTGSITSSGLATTPVNANVSTVDAVDTVRFSIVLQNLGDADAYDLRLQDLLPTGYELPTGGLGLNLIVTNGNGTAISWRGLGGGTSSDLFGSGIELLDPTAVYLVADSGNITTRMSNRNDFNPATNEQTLGPWVNGSDIEALTMNPTTGVLYSSNNNQLGTINRTTGANTFVGSGFGTANGTLGSFALNAVNGLSVHPTTNALYGVHKRLVGPDLIFKVNTTTGAFIANAFGAGRDYIPINTDAAGVGAEIDDIAFDPTNGNLFATMADRLIRITLNEAAGTSTITNIGLFGSGVADMEGLSFDRNGNLWGTTGNSDGAENNRLWEVNKSTGAASNFRQLDSSSDYEGLVADGPGVISALRSLTHATSAGDGSNVIVLTYDLRLASTVAPRQTITNTATLTNYAATDFGSDLTAVNPSDTAITTISAATTAKSLVGTGITSASNSASQAAIGETVQYSVTVTLPEGTLPGSFVLDNLDEGLQFVSLDAIAAFSGGVARGALTSSVGAFGSTALFDPTVSGTGAAGSPQSLSFDLGTLTNTNSNNSAAETLVLTYSVRVANIAQNSGNGAAIGTLRNNAAHFEWTANSTMQSTLNANAANVEVIEPQLNVAKSVDDSTPNLGDVVTYTLTLTHTAASDTDAFDIRLLDTLPAGTTLNLGSIMASGATILTDASAGNTLNVTLDEVVFGDTVTLTFTATVTSTVGDIGLTLSNTVAATWTSLSGGSVFERDGDIPAGVDNYTDSSTNNATVVNPALSVTIDNGAASVSASQAYSYSVVVTNDGNSSATGIVVTGTIPLDPLTFLNTDDDLNFVFNYGTGEFTWTPAAASLAAGGSLTLTLNVEVPNPLAAGINDIVVSANVTHDNIEPTPANNTDSDTDLLNAAPDLMLTKTDGDISVNPGDSVVYTLSYCNHGTQDATGVFIDEVLPTNATFNAAPSTAGWTDLGGGNYRINIGSVAAGASGNVLFAVTVNSTLPAGVTQLSNSATVTDDATNGTDPTADNTGSDTTPLDAAPDYNVSIDDGQTNVTEGQSLTYTVNFENAGDQDGTGVVITATFPPAILENLVASNGGVVDTMAGTITWAVGNLAAGASGSFTVTTDVRDPVPGGTTMFTLSTSITDDTANGAEPTPADNFDDDTDNIVFNDAPTSVDNSVTTPEDTDFVFAASDFPFGDVDGDVLAEVRIDSLPSDGTLLLNGTPVTAGDVIDIADINGGLLVFRPVLDETGSPYTTFQFSVGDGLLFSVAPNTLTVNVTPTVVSIVKSYFDSSDGTTLGNNVTIGETVTFALLVTLSEGSTSDLIVVDEFPDGLQYVGLTLVSTAAGSGGLLAADFAGMFPAPVTTGGTLDGEDVTFTFGMINITVDGDSTNNSFVILVQALVTDVPSNSGLASSFTTLTNVATADVSNPTPPTSSTSDVTIVEPQIEITKTASISTGDAGDVVTYTLTIQHTSESTGVAHDIVISDLLTDSDLLLVAGSVDASLGSVVGIVSIGNTSGDTTVVVDVSQLVLGETVVITFQAVVQTTAVMDESADNSATADWDSLGGPNGRTGSDSDEASVDIAVPTMTKTLVSTGIISATNSLTEATIGEFVQYELVISLPEGTLPAAFVIDNLDEGLQFVRLDLIDGYRNGFPAVGVVTSSLGTLSDTGLMSPTITGSGATAMHTID